MCTYRIDSLRVYIAAELNVNPARSSIDHVFRGMPIVYRAGLRDATCGFIESTMLAVSVTFLILSVIARLLIRADHSEAAFSKLNTPEHFLLLTAHPDDEAFFFGPTITALVSESNAKLYSLCLSIGDADGQGKKRITELSDSLDVLGIDKDKRWVLDVECALHHLIFIAITDNSSHLFSEASRTISRSAGNRNS